MNTDCNYKDYEALISDGKIQYDDNVGNAMTRCHEAVPSMYVWIVLFRQLPYISNGCCA